MDFFEREVGSGMTGNGSCTRGDKRKSRAIVHLVALSLALAMAGNVRGQEGAETNPSSGPSVSDLARQVSELQNLVRQLQAQVRELRTSVTATNNSNQ